MKVIVSAQTVNSFHTCAGTELRSLMKAICPGISDEAIAAAFSSDGWECTEFANYSITKVGDEWVLEINDEGMFKYMRVYGRIARCIAPFIAPIKALMWELKADMADIDRWVNQRK